MSGDILDTNLTELFGLETMSEEEREAFLDNVGGLIIESVITRLTIEMNEQEIDAVHGLLTSSVDADDLLMRLEKNYPSVNQLFKEEIEAFRREAIAVLASPNQEN